MKEKTEVTILEPAFSGLLSDLLEKNLSVRFKAKGFSMSPFIKNNDVLTVSPRAQMACTLGDVVAYVHPRLKKTVVHRIIGLNIQDYLIKGDNSSQADGLVPQRNILGDVTKIERNGKAVRFGLGCEKYFIAVLSRCGILFHLLYIFRRARKLLRNIKK